MGVGKGFAMKGMIADEGWVRVDQRWASYGALRSREGKLSTRDGRHWERACDMQHVVYEGKDD